MGHKNIPERIPFSKEYSDFQWKELSPGSTFLDSYHFSWSLLLICKIKVVTKQYIGFIFDPSQKINDENKRTETVSGDQ